MISRCDSAAIVPNTSELLPEPETPVNTVSRRFGSAMLRSLRLFTRAPCTRIRSWLSAPCGARDCGWVFVLIVSRPRIPAVGGAGGKLNPQLAAFFTSAPIFFSSAAASSFNA